MPLDDLDLTRSDDVVPRALGSRPSGRECPPDTTDVALSFVRSVSDDVLRGVAALECASLRSRRLINRNRLFKLTYWAAVAAVAVCAAAIAPERASAYVVFASIPLSTWLLGALATAWSTLDAAGSAFTVPDAVAAELAGGEAPVIDALLAMESWLEATRASRPWIERVAHRCATPILPSAHTESRVALLRAQAEAA